MIKTTNKIASMQIDKKLKIIENMKKFSVKNQDELDLLEVYQLFIFKTKADPQK